MTDGASPDGPRVPRRRLPGADREVPVLGGPVPDAFGLGLAPSDDRAGQALLRRAVDAGIRLLDAGPVATTPVAEELVGRARLANVDVATTLTGARSADDVRLPGVAPPGPPSVPGAFGPHATAWAEEATRAVDRALSRLAAPQLAVAWIDAAELDAAGHAPVQAALADDPRVGAWGVRFDGNPPSAELLGELLRSGVRLFGLSVHLLNAPDLAPRLATIRRAGGGVIDLDPHAEGRLNGARLADGRLRPGGGPPHPIDWASVRAELAPVTRLAFLTQDRRRTLGQAAIRYALGAEGVVSVLVPIADPRRLAEWIGAFDRPDLSDVERLEVEEARAPTPPAAPARASEK